MAYDRWTFSNPYGKNHNKLLHQQKNSYTLAEDAVLDEWYQSNRHTLLAHHDHFIFHNIDTATIYTPCPADRNGNGYGTSQPPRWPTHKN